MVTLVGFCLVGRGTSVNWSSRPFNTYYFLSHDKSPQLHHSEEVMSDTVLSNENMLISKESTLINTRLAGLHYCICSNVAKVPMYILYSLLVYSFILVG